MKFFTLFIGCFGVLSILPLFWNHFEITSFGYPFPFYNNTEFIAKAGNGMSLAFVPINIFFDLLAAFLVSSVIVFAIHYIKKAQR